MLEILPSPDHVAAYRLSGILDDGDYDRMIADIEARLGRHDKIAILADLADFRDMTFQAGLKDMRYSLSKLFQLNRFSREAVITDKEWIRTAVRLLDPVIPFMAIRTFEPGEAEAAMAWASAKD
ncbi:MAG: STAS/SEC14 domain-containing protein [Sphingomonas sp.]|nr:STAS/SEC14 domain-containing protein [Sphingomonas sp.]MDX3884097.1 STAS/SEC14 domain-containing protein [Sphingomonas sp.]